MTLTVSDGIDDVTMEIPLSSVRSLTDLSGPDFDPATFEGVSFGAGAGGSDPDAVDSATGSLVDTGEDQRTPLLLGFLLVLFGGVVTAVGARLARSRT